MHDDTGASLENRLARRLISLGDIKIAKRCRVVAREGPREGRLHDQMATLPDHQRCGIG